MTILQSTHRRPVVSISSHTHQASFKCIVRLCNLWTMVNIIIPLLTRIGSLHKWFVLRCLGTRHVNIKMPSPQYRNSHYKDKTVVRPSYLYNGNLCTRKAGLYIETGPQQPVEPGTAEQPRQQYVVTAHCSHGAIYSHCVGLPLLITTIDWSYGTNQLRPLGNNSSRWFGGNNLLTPLLGIRPWSHLAVHGNRKTLKCKGSWIHC